MDAPMKYAFVIEQCGQRYRAYVPDLPGCMATGDSPDEAEQGLSLAIRYHLADLKRSGHAVPPPTSRVNYVRASV